MLWTNQIAECLWAVIIRVVYHSETNGFENESKVWKKYFPFFCFPQGAAFGFSSIAAHAGDQLAPYLPKLVPRLYRYQYDPSGPVRQAMSSIWSALVKDNKNVVS